MPRKRTYGKRKRPARKRPHRRRTYRSRNGIPSGMPRTRRAYLRYCDQLSITSTTGLIGTDIYRANSVYDPYQPSGGHQPMGYDVWASMYNHYVVKGARIRITPAVDTSAASPCMFGVYLSDDVTPPYSTWTAYMEARKGTCKQYLGRQSFTKSAISKYSAKQFYNIKDVRDNVSRIGAGTASNPTEEALFIVWVQNMDSSTDSYLFNITIDYIVEFSEPRDLPQS